MNYFYTLPPSLLAEQQQFFKDVNEFIRGNINPTKFKAIRVAHGVYEQRQNHTYMVRIRCAAGGITPQQLKRVAELGKNYGGGEVHFTTRQEVQIHNVLLHHIDKVINSLREVGLSSRGGGGNTIRNILTPPTSGIVADEVFDVDPYAIALTSRLISEPDSWNLPRKFKIAFSFNKNDSSFTQTTCLGFLAVKENGVNGFKVYCAGGMGAKPMVGHLLMDFVPAEKIYQVTKALKVMFDKYGNRRSKTTSRIKFLWKKLQREEFERLFFVEYDKLKDDSSLDLVVKPLSNGVSEADGNYSNFDSSFEIEKQVEQTKPNYFKKWKERFVRKQKQAGFYYVKLPLKLGDLYHEDAFALSDFLMKLPEEGVNTIRCDRAQNVIIRNIPEALLANLFNLIMRMKETLAESSPFVSNMINCTGASTCKLGICLPRGLSKAIRDELLGSDLNLDELNHFRLNMSGCPNTCGMHHIAHLGFFGKVGRKAGNMFPSYNVLLGARVGSGKTEYAKKYGEIAAHQVPRFVKDFLGYYLSKKNSYVDYYTFLENEGISWVEKKLGELAEQVPTLESDKTYYTDFGAKKRISLEEIGTAECSAGMFDMIGIDKKSITNYLKSLENEEEKGKLTEPELAKALHSLIFYSSRMLLVTRGLEGKTETEVFQHFKKHFVITGLVATKFEGLLSDAIRKDDNALIQKQDQVIALAKEVLQLYKTMDDSLRFRKDQVA